MSIRDEILNANERYAAAFDKAGLPRSPTRGFAVVTCMDARLDPARFLGLEEGDAHVIRNAGGSVSDEVLRSLALSHEQLGTREALVIGHRDCAVVTDVVEHVRDGLDTIRSTPLLPESFGATGFVFDVATGRIEPVD
jgi:carbonic anhydrase